MKGAQSGRGSCNWCRSVLYVYVCACVCAVMCAFGPCVAFIFCILTWQRIPLLMATTSPAKAHNRKGAHIYTSTHTHIYTHALTQVSVLLKLFAKGQLLNLQTRWQRGKAANANASWICVCSLLIGFSTFPFWPFRGFLLFFCCSFFAFRFFIAIQRNGYK